MPDVLLTDGGLETSLIYHQGLDLPLFAAFPLLYDDDGTAALRAYWEPYLALAREHNTGFVMDTATWRANPDWASRLGYDADGLCAVNGLAARFARQLVAGVDGAFVNGVVGPRGDGYVVGQVMPPEQAADYHTEQIAALAEAGVDQVAALTITHVEEAIGFVWAAEAIGIASVVSFTVETDGRLPSGQSLRSAVASVDGETRGAASGFMINCAHPTHFIDALVDGDWLHRVIGIRANSSTMSHAELDAAEDLDEGDPLDLARQYQVLLERLPALTVLGGCCGTDIRHVRAISEACRAS
jgi:S-methylmethionine-dependent homocysteine/selenocysteine methylase